MLDQVAYPESNEYHSNGKNEPVEFFLNALTHSVHFDLLLGYFSSSALNILSLGFANFIHRGGKVRIVFNHILSKNDKKAILQGKNTLPHEYDFSIENYHRIKDALDDYGKHFFNCLAWLIASKKLEIKSVKPKEKKGIAHYKSGVFTDINNNKVKFKSSCNFTWYGLTENLEELEIKSSWESNKNVAAISDYQEYFDSIFNEQVEFVEYLSISDLTEAIKTNFGNKELEELLVDEERLLKKKKKYFNDQKINTILQSIINTNNILLNSPRFPYEAPRAYQQKAYNKWKSKNYNGIFAMATGTGKTITSLNCLLNIYKENNSYKAIILVPTIALVNQWKKECKKFNFRNIICVSSKEKWDENLSFYNTASKFVDTSFIVIVTYASFLRKRFQSYFRQLPNDTLLIADEMHSIGSPKILATLNEIHLQKRIGLSATPNRKYDDEGNRGIEKFFEDSYPYTFSYSMEEAITLKPYALSPYTYYPHIVYLRDYELSKYIEKSKQLLKYFDSKKGKYKDCKEVEILLLERKRIIHKAQDKKSVFKKILKEEFQKRGNLKYTLVYVPEGVDVDYGTRDKFIESEDEANLINKYTRIVSDTDLSIMVQQFTSKTKNRESILEKFASGETHVLCSMKCLDEGVDVPRSELAIFCASTGNPRQFIQRRGRILRLHDDKNFATIHDLVVIPKSDDPSTYEMERSILRKELERVVDFSSLSMNKIDTYETLAEALDYYNLNLNDF